MGVNFKNVFGMFFNKLTFIQNTVPKEHDAAKHASTVSHEAPVLMFLKGKRRTPPLPYPLSPLLLVVAGTISIATALGQPSPLRPNQQQDSSIFTHKKIKSDRKMDIYTQSPYSNVWY